MSASDDPAGAVSERTWTIYVCENGCGNVGSQCARCPKCSRRGPALIPQLDTEYIYNVPVEVVSADWRAAALELAKREVMETLQAGLASLSRADVMRGGNRDYRFEDRLERAESALARVRSLDKEGHGG